MSEFVSFLYPVNNYGLTHKMFFATLKENLSIERTEYFITLRELLDQRYR